MLSNIFSPYFVEVITHHMRGRKLKIKGYFNKVVIYLFNHSRYIYMYIYIYIYIYTHTHPFWFIYSSNPNVGGRVNSQKRVHGKEEITKYVSHLYIYIYIYTII